MSAAPGLPRHIAIIMDGNGRWARSRLLPRAEGHRQGVYALERVVDAAARRGVKALTVFAFSSENWRRPASEVSALMRLFATGLERWEKPLAEAGVRLRVIGDRTAFSESLNRTIDRTESATASGAGMRLNIAANYGGRWDLLQAAQAAAAAGELTADGIERRLCAIDDGEVDLLIRTGGERRISNFLADRLRGVLLHGHALAGLRRVVPRRRHRLVRRPRAALRHDERAAARRGVMPPAAGTKRTEGGPDSPRIPSGCGSEAPGA